MIKQRGVRSCGNRRTRLLQLTVGAAILATTACAEIEFGSEIFKNAARTNGPPVQPVLSSSVIPDAIDPTLRADPEAFYATGLALWDGERTLAGIWIAHPVAQIARQVRLTNNETGTRVDAAMFRRDPNLSGPRIIVSSEAAKRLGLAPDLGTQITIEGLAYGAVAVATGPIAEPVSDPADLQAEAVTAEPAAIEVTAVADLGAAPLATSPAATTTAPKPVSAEITPSTDTGNESGAKTIASTTSWNTEDEIERARQEQQETQTASIPVTAAEIPLPLTRPVVPAPAPKIEPEPESTPEASGDITDGRNFIQAGVFGQAENAARLVEKLRAVKLPAKEVPLTLGERQFTRVVIGPYRTIAERNAALEVVRTLGPADATPVRG